LGNDSGNSGQSVRNPKSQRPSSKQIPSRQIPKWLAVDLKIGALFAWALELGIWNFLPQFAAKLRRLYNSFRYDEVTA
jgi:hypothetical protein